MSQESQSHIDTLLEMTGVALDGFEQGTYALRDLMEYVKALGSRDPLGRVHEEVVPVAVIAERLGMTVEEVRAWYDPWRRPISRGPYDPD
jgi:hypothetical protein